MSREPIYFYLTGNWYKGKMPNFYDVSTLESTQVLKEAYAEIKEEILDYFNKNPNGIKPNKTPAKYNEVGWKNMSLYAFGLKFEDHARYFPKLTRIAESIPHMISAQIAVLEPNTRVKAHFGDTNAIVRSHLGIVVPGEYPIIGIRNGSQEQCWEEGEVLSICISHRHYVWNYTKRKRIILIVDTIHPDYLADKYYITSSLLASQTMKIFTSKYSSLKKLPKPLVLFIHKVLLIPFLIVLLLQEKAKVNVVKHMMKFR